MDVWKRLHDEQVQVSDEEMDVDEWPNPHNHNSQCTIGNEMNTL